MAFIKLFPPEGRDALAVADVILRLEDEFAVVDADPDEGQDHVAGMIAATLRFSDAIPGKRERLSWLQSVQDAAVYVSFGDDLGTMAGAASFRTRSYSSAASMRWTAPPGRWSSGQPQHSGTGCSRGEAIAPSGKRGHRRYSS